VEVKNEECKMSKAEKATLEPGKPMFCHKSHELIPTCNWIFAHAKGIPGVKPTAAKYSGKWGRQLQFFIFYF
jgi:hypothetical protein